MTLKELRIAPEHKIRIRTKDGSNFIFIGMAGEVDFETLNKETKVRATAKLLDAVYNYDPNHTGWFDKAVRDFKAWKPVEDREVVEQYPGQLEYSTVIVITGGEGWIPYNPSLAPLEKIDEQGAESLVTQIYKGICTELVHAYEVGSEDLIERAEREIRKNRYGILDQPEGIIRACRIRAGKE